MRRFPSRESGATLEKLAVEKLVAPLAVIDIREKARSNPDALLTADDIRFGRVPSAGAFVFVGASKVANAAGGPVRSIATFPGSAAPTAPERR